MFCIFFKLADYMLPIPPFTEAEKSLINWRARWVLLRRSLAMVMPRPKKVFRSPWVEDVENAGTRKQEVI